MTNKHTSTKLGKDAPSSDSEQRRSQPRIDPLEMSALALGGILLWFGAFGNSQFLQRYFSFLDFLNWTPIAKIAFILTVVFLGYWIRIFFGFLHNSLDEYDAALAARYMRATFFLACSLWSAAYFTSPDVWSEYRVEFLKFVKFGIVHVKPLLVFFLLFLLCGATIYLLFRWLELKFGNRN